MAEYEIDPDARILIHRYPLPHFMDTPRCDGQVPHQVYVKWLTTAANAHARRDWARLGWHGMVMEMRDMIHEAVVATDGRDAYTGELLDWGLIRTYKNHMAKVSAQESPSAQRTEWMRARNYRRGFSLLPTVDHVIDAHGEIAFKICAWRINDAKSDMSPDEFLKLCQQVVSFGDEKAEKR